jgi:ABC-type Zn uptake system ZnuABC Zn-binding protein ZnuA
MRNRPSQLLALAVIAFLGVSVAAPQPARAKVRVVTSTPTLADIAARIGGDHADVQSIMRGPENVHNVIAKPSSMMKLRKADLLIHSGLDAEPWVPMLIKGARNAEILYGRSGNVDVSPGIALKEVPRRGELSRALGDIHVYGNTHYALDPLNGIIIARTITAAFKRTDPAHRNEFDANYEAFAQRMRALTERLEARMEPYRGTPVVIYHRTWPYFLDRFGLVKVAEIEPKPGIAPGPRHLSRCVEAMEARGARVVIVETYNPKKNADKVAGRVGGTAVVLAQEVRALPDVDTYEELFEHNVEALVAVFQQLGIQPASPSAETGRP